MPTPRRNLRGNLMKNWFAVEVRIFFYQVDREDIDSDVLQAIPM